MAEGLDVHVISHTHWDREWYLTREQFRLRLVDLVDRVLDLIDGDPRFSAFHLDGQTIVLEDYLEVRPERERRLARRIAEGKLLVGPWYVMPDMFLVSGESLVRNLALGYRIAERFGAAMPVGYMPDPFGHVAQMPQILAGFGIDNAVLWRGFAGPKAEYLWAAPDGSRVLMLHLPREGYCNGLRLPLLPPERQREANALIMRRERERSAFGKVLLMVGVDHVEPHPTLPQLVARIAGEPGVRARLSTLPAYVEAVKQAARAHPGALQKVVGELRDGEEYAPLLPGVLSTRIYLKQANAAVQTTLERWAEPAAVLAWLAGAEYPTGILAYAWKTLLQNHPHDSICGCSIDAVHEENMTRFARAGQAAEGVAGRSLAVLARGVPPPPPGALRVLVVSTDTRPHAGVVDGIVEIPIESAEPGRHVDPALMDRPLSFFPAEGRIVAATDPEGRPVAFQVLGQEDSVVHRMSRFEPPWALKVRHVRVALWADEVPPSGFTTVDLRLGEEAAGWPPPPAAVTAGPGFMENDLLRVEVNADGTLDVHDKRSGAWYRRCAELEDTGDVGDEYDYAPPAGDRRLSNTQASTVAVKVANVGPLRAALHIRLELPVPARATPDRRGRSEEKTPLQVSLQVTLDAASPRLAFSAAVDNAADDHRLRVLFAAGASAAAARSDTAFGVVERPARRPAAVSSAPLQSVVDVGDVSAGIMVFGDGLHEYEVLPGDESRVALTLLRCVGDLSRDDLSTRPGHAGPGLRTPGAQCRGPHVYRFAVEPRSAPLLEGELLARARSFTTPPRLFSPAGGSGRLPPRLSFLRLSCEPAGGAVLSACKKAEDRDSIILRLFNPGSAETILAVEAVRPIVRAFRTDLRERRQDELRIEGGRAQLTLPPYRIQTIELLPAPAI